MVNARFQKRLAALAAGCVALAAAFLAGRSGQTARGAVGVQATLPGFTSIAFLNHVNDPKKTPGFPGDPVFKLSTAFTVAEDGFYLQYLKEGEHTGTHWGAPCHFHDDEVCADELAAEDLVLPAVVVDVRSKVQQDVDYQVSVADLQAWEATYGPMPQGAAVIAWTGCSRYWANGDEPRDPTYYNCGSARAGLHQPGFSLAAVKWLIAQGVLGDRGALGTDTFGPDPGTDERLRESSLVFHEHRIDLENLTNLKSLPPVGAWIVVGGPINHNGSGSPGTIYGLVP